jgi:ComF family protein
MIKILHSLLNILFPKICNGCDRALSAHEKIMCTSCRHQVPLAGFHKTNANTLKKIFYGRTAIEEATALLTFQKKGITQKLLHNLKYKKQEDVSAFLGIWLGAELSEIDAYKKVNLVIPVPLHKDKKRSRGYNQVSGFGRAIAAALEVPYVDDVLVKVSKTDSQVFKGRLKRIQDPQVFMVSNAHLIENMHILLVDDIVTTGATLENCAEKLCQHENVKISIATMAISL